MQKFVIFHQFILKILSGKEILTQVKGHNSLKKCTDRLNIIPTQKLSISMHMHNSVKVLKIGGLSYIELDLYFMIIYQFMKYESNTPLYSNDIARKPFFVRTDGQTDGRTDKGDAIT